MKHADRYRIVMDTNAIIAAGSSWVMNLPPMPSPDNYPSRVVHSVITFHDGLICEDILLEYAEKLEARNHPPDRITRYLGYLAGACELVDIVTFHCLHYPQDPDDIIFILCALNGNADYLISDDNHLLDLTDHYDPPKIRTREQMRATLGL